MKKIPFQKIWNDFKSFCKRFYEWKHENVWICILKILSLILVFIMVFLFVFEVLPVLLGFAVLFLVLKWANEPTQNQPVFTPHADTYIARDLLFEALTRTYETLDIIRPGNVEEITPVSYPVPQHVNGVLFYRFIVRYQSEYDDDFSKKKETLNICMGQILQAGFPNVMIPFYKDVPRYMVFKMGVDSHHSGYFYIDVMPVINDTCYIYLCQLKNAENFSHDNLDLFSPDDEDF